MGTARRANRLGGAIAATLAAIAILALLASGGCELAVSDTIPGFTCVPGAAANCPAGQVCVPSTHQCTPIAGTCTPGAAAACPAGMRCDPQMLRCTGSTSAIPDAAGDGTLMETSPDSSSDAHVGVADGALVADASGDAHDASMPDAPADAPGPCRGITCGCRGPADCDSGVCADTLTATTALANALNGMSFCTQPCCTSTDCPGNTVCFGTGGGGDYCVAPNWIGRAVEQALAPGGTACTANGDCRSGLCNTSNNQCADTCCSSAQPGQCANGTVCRYAAFPGTSFDTHETAWCGAAIGTSAGGSVCAVDATCQSGKCANFTRCEAVCRSTTDCGNGQACSYGLGPTTLPANKDIVAGCVNVTGNVANGGSCTSNADCQSAFCDGSGKCTDVCVTDNDCKGGLHCRPVVVQVQGSYSVLCCES